MAQDIMPGLGMLQQSLASIAQQRFAEEQAEEERKWREKMAKNQERFAEGMAQQQADWDKANLLARLTSTEDIATAELAFRGEALERPYEEAGRARGGAGEAFGTLYDPEGGLYGGLPPELQQGVGATLGLEDPYAAEAARGILGPQLEGFGPRTPEQQLEFDIGQAELGRMGALTDLTRAQIEQMGAGEYQQVRDQYGATIGAFNVRDGTIQLHSGQHDSWTSAARQFAGVGYEWGGEAIEGADCSGFATCVENQMYGADLPRLTTESLHGEQRRYFDVVTSPMPGDLVLWENHVGVVLEGGMMASMVSREAGYREEAIQDAIGSRGQPEYLRLKPEHGRHFGPDDLANLAQDPERLGRFRMAAQLLGETFPAMTDQEINDRAFLYTGGTPEPIMGPEPEVDLSGLVPVEPTWPWEAGGGPAMRQAAPLDEYSFYEDQLRRIVADYVVSPAYLERPVYEPPKLLAAVIKAIEMDPKLLPAQREDLIGRLKAALPAIWVEETP